MVIGPAGELLQSRLQCERLRKALAVGLVDQTLGETDGARRPSRQATGDLTHVAEKLRAGDYAVDQP